MIALLVLVLIIAFPWFLPQSMSSQGPLKYIKAITTFPLTYEWTHSYKYAPTGKKSGAETGSNDIEKERKASESLFPLAVGNKWIYEHRKTGTITAPSEKISEKTMEVQEKKALAEVDIYKIVSTEDGNTSFAWYFWDVEGLHTTRNTRHPWVQSVWVLKASPVEGDEWYEMGNAGRLNSVVGREEITVPMGKFDCLVIESRTSSSQDSLYRTWFAEGFGIIRQSFGPTNRGTDTWELKSFTSG